MKKALAITLALMLTIGLLAACGGDATPASEPANDTPAVAPAPEPTPEPEPEPAPAGFDTANAITVVSREDGSGTRGAFVELTGVLSEDDEDMTTIDAVQSNSTSVVMTTVAGDPFAIGYISLGSLNDTVKAVAVEGVAPSVATVKDGSYAISRPFALAVKDGLSDAAQDFIDFILSAEGQAVVEENGYITVNDAAAAYAGAKPAGKVVVAGSSSVTPVMEKLQEAYALVNPNAELEIQMSDSSAGMQNTIDGVCDIGMASRELKDSETGAGLTPIIMAMDGIAVIVNNENPAGDLTLGQIKGIFTGEATTWDAV